jgi:predicted nucleotide-binding protein (sugar kinase/HSP70/actin superfamily)
VAVHRFRAVSDWVCLPDMTCGESVKKKKKKKKKKNIIIIIKKSDGEQHVSPCSNSKNSRVSGNLTQGQEIQSDS